MLATEVVNIILKAFKEGSTGLLSLALSLGSGSQTSLSSTLSTPFLLLWLVWEIRAGRGGWERRGRGSGNEDAEESGCDNE